jgi:hypothetical protein
MNVAQPSRHYSISSRDVEELLSHLPPLPRVQRYYDSVQERSHTIEDYPDWTRLRLFVDGRTRCHDFDSAPTHLMRVIRYVVSDLFSQLDAKTVSTHLGNLKNCHLTVDCLNEALGSSPQMFRAWWLDNCRSQLSERKCGAIKAVLRALCRLAIGSWSDDYVDFVSKLPTPPKNRYHVLDSGACFLPIEHQGLISDWLDDVAFTLARSPETCSDKRLRGACELGISFQLGIRPVQIAAIKSGDVTIRDGRVYVRILKAKQRDQGPLYVIRRLRPQWSLFWIEFAERRSRMTPALHANPDSFLLLPPERISTELSDVVEEVAGKRWTPNDFRHTGAQRLADAGASHAEIQDYLMHETDGAANVYYSGSASQAEKVNRAMGMSSIYQGVAKLARGEMVDRTELEGMPSDNQVGGLPHGISIAGIGACELGQSHCVKNPVLSCYGCNNFLPLNEPSIHESVADGLRQVVGEFYSASNGADASPAYGQLRRTIEAADFAATQAGYSSRRRH